MNAGGVFFWTNTVENTTQNQTEPNQTNNNNNNNKEAEFFPLVAKILSFLNSYFFFFPHRKKIKSSEWKSTIGYSSSTSLTRDIFSSSAWNHLTKRRLVSKRDFIYFLRHQVDQHAYFLLFSFARFPPPFLSRSLFTPTRRPPTPFLFPPHLHFLTLADDDDTHALWWVFFTFSTSLPFMAKDFRGCRGRAFSQKTKKIIFSLRIWTRRKKRPGRSKWRKEDFFSPTVSPPIATNGWQTTRWGESEGKKGRPDAPVGATPLTTSWSAEKNRTKYTWLLEWEQALLVG